MTEEGEANPFEVPFADEHSGSISNHGVEKCSQGVNQPHHRRIASDARKKGPFAGRLQELVVCELHEDGSRKLQTMTLRDLYAYTMTAITNRDSTGRWELQRGASVALATCRNGLMRSPLDSKSTRYSSKHLVRDSNEEQESKEGGEEDDQVHVTRRERLGEYLHPRDMRRLVTPFSSSNAPALMVRRHVMLLNFDPLRAILLRDRVLALVSKSSDSPILVSLEKRLRGGIDAVERNAFGEESQHPPTRSTGAKTSVHMNRDMHKETAKKDEKKPIQDFGTSSKTEKESSSDVDMIPNETFDTGMEVDEWDDIDEGSWKDIAFELQAVDCVLSTVCSMLSEDANELRLKIIKVVGELQGASRSKTPGEREQEKLRLMKDQIGEMEARIQGFVRAMDVIMDDDKDMALMNLSRLLTHRDRYIQPVSEDILEEEASEPEIILEVYHHHALSMVNALELLKGQITSTEDLISMRLDTVRNRLLYLNTILSLVALCVAASSLVGSIFGMNLLNSLEEDENVFLQVVVGTLVGALLLLLLLAFAFYKAGVLPSVLH